MKTLSKLILILTAVFFFAACQKDKNTPPDQTNEDSIETPTHEAFASLQSKALDERMQKFPTTLGDKSTNLTSDSGVVLTIDPGSIVNQDGDPVSGEFEVDFIELYDAGTMLVTNKRTMGDLGNGKLSLIVTGGAFYINATQNGEDLKLADHASIHLDVPADLTGGVDTSMILWDGTIGQDGNLTWKEIDNTDDPKRNYLDPDVENVQYHANFGNFGWTNIDRFFNDDRPKTEILAEVPDGYDDTNSAVYLKYEGEPNALANLDMYDTSKDLFTEHYGQIPIGLKCHIIFVTESDNDWRVATQTVTIEDGKTYKFKLSDTQVVDEDHLVQMINDLP